jgi:uncharacterized repeat protein (TIGR01451 family)
MSGRNWSRYLRAAVPTAALAVAAAGVLGTLPAAAAQDAAYAAWALSGQSGQVTVPVAGFPEGTLASTSTGLRAPSGSSAFLDASTPPGAELGSSRGQGYLSFGTAPGRKPSETTITFSSPTPAAGWGFVLGDVDAERIRVTAEGADGKELAVGVLGWQGAFNYCQAKPRPSACTRPATFGDKPHWDAGTSTLVGNVADTDGASGWFMPTVAVKSLTFVLSVQSGSPAAQLWVAAREPAPPASSGDVAIALDASKLAAVPGDQVDYTITISDVSDHPALDARVRDDLANVLDAAHYDHDATASGGDMSYSTPDLTWHGDLYPGQTVTITYSVTVDINVSHRLVLSNVLTGDRPGEYCACHGGSTCTATVVVIAPVVVPCRAPGSLARAHASRVPARMGPAC